MPVINSNIAETIDITENGSHNVARYTTANVTVSPNTTSLNVTPSTSAQQLTPTAGVDGFDEVNVSAVTSSIDANIIPENIKKGISILGVTGTHEGGGSGEKGSYIGYDVDESGKLTPSETPIDVGEATDVSANALTYAYAGKTLDGDVDFSSLNTVTGEKAFYQAFRDTQFEDEATIDLSNVSTVSGSNAFEGTFSGCTVKNDNSKSVSVDFSGLTSVSGTKSFSSAFSRGTAAPAVEPDFSALEEITGTEAFSSMFASNPNISTYSFPALTKIWTTGAFKQAFNSSNITSVSFPVLEKIGRPQSYSPSVSKIVADYTFQNAFSGNTHLTTVNFPLLKSITGTNVFDSAFKGCTSLTTVNMPLLEGFTSPNTFEGCTSLTQWPLPNITNFGGEYAFKGCTGFTDVIVPKVRSGTWTNTFKDCSNMTAIKLYHYSGSSARTNTVSDMFNGCSSLTNIYIYGASLQWDMAAGEWGSGGGNNWLRGTNGVTVHLPKRCQPNGGPYGGEESNMSIYDQYPNFGGTNVTLLYDITGMLLAGKMVDKWDGSRMVMYDRQYYRQQDLSTSSYTAWSLSEIYDPNSDYPEYTVLYYTPGTDGWNIGDKIYLDPECTMSADTIADIYWEPSTYNW